MSELLVRYQVADGVAEILLDRPPINALGPHVIDQLLAALQRARDDADVRAVIVASTQKVFARGSISMLFATSPASRPNSFSRGFISR